MSVTNSKTQAAGQENLSAAVAWHGQGFTIFPVDPEKNAPRFIGYQSAKMSPDEIRTHWKLHPADLVGLLQDQTFTIDVDVKNGKDGRPWLAANRTNLPETFEVETPSGGRHLIYWIPEGVTVRNDSSGKIAIGVDIKGNGEGGTHPGYVIAARTAKPGGRSYTALNELPIAQPSKWLLDIVSQPAGMRSSTDTRPTEVTAPGKLTSELERHCSTVRGLPPGNQQEIFSLAALHVGSLVRDGLDEAVAIAALVEAGLTMANALDRDAWTRGELEKNAKAKIAKGRQNPAKTIESIMGAAPSAGLLPGMTANAPLPGTGRATVTHRIGEDHTTRADINDALASRDVPIFNFGGELHLINGNGLHRLDEHELRPIVSENVEFFRYENKDGAFVAKKCDVPATIIRSILTPSNASGGSFRKLRALITSPFIHRDGSIHNKIGYDAPTKLYMTGRLNLPVIPERPTRDDALAALAIIRDELLSEFRFVDPQDEAATLAMLFSAVTRPAIAHQPLFFISAPQKGAGKSYLTEILSELQLGRPAVAMSYPRSNDELDKQIHTAMLIDRRIIFLDNVARTLESVPLSQALTQSEIAVRILGKSRDVVRETGATTFVANGVNLEVSDDLERRTIAIYLDTRMEHAQLRSFVRSPVDLIRNDRGRYLAALMTIVRARIQSGFQHELKLAGFDEWNSMVRGTILWLGMPDPWRLLSSQSPEQEETADRLAVLFDNQPLVPWTPAHWTVPGFIGESVRTAFGDMCERDLLNLRRFGRWCGKNENRIVDGLVIRRTSGRDEKGRIRDRWLVERIPQ